MSRSALAEILDLHLRQVNGGLRDYVLAARAAGQSWRSIADEITRETGRPVTHETLRRWLKAEDTAPDPQAVA